MNRNAFRLEMLKNENTVLESDFTPSARLRLNVCGLGDVGGNLALGLLLLSDGAVSEIGLYDPDEAKVERYYHELGQIRGVGTSFPAVRKLDDSMLFDGDMFIFTASRGVPPVGEENVDVREVQFEANRKILDIYAKKAIEEGFAGTFCVLSDPVDHLCMAAVKSGLKPEKVMGFGQGVMYARSIFNANRLGIESDGIRVFGPHGKDLLVLNSAASYDDEKTEILTRETVTANLAVREIGYKPFIAPAISSGAISIIDVIKGSPHYSCQYIGGMFFGGMYSFSHDGLNVHGGVTDKNALGKIELTWENVRKSYEKYKVI